MTSSSRGWRRQSAPYAVLRLSGQGLEFVGWIVFARRLAPSAFGVLAVAFLVCRYLGLIADWGAVWRGPRDVAARGRHGSVRALVRRRTTLAPVFAALVALALVVLGHAALAPVALVVLGFGLTRDWIAIGLGRGVIAGVPSLVQGTLLIGGALVLTDSLSGSVVGVAYLGAALLSISLNRIPPEPSDVGPIIQPDAWLLSASMAIQVLSTTDIVLLGVLRSSAEAGTYAAVYRFPNAWLAVLAAVLVSLTPSATTAFHNDPDAYRALVRRALRASAVAGLVVVCSTPVVVWLSMTLLGSQYSDGRASAAVLTVATAIITFSAPLHPLAMATGRDRRYATIVIIASVCNVVVNLAVIPRWGMVAAASATLFAQSLVAFGLWRLVTESAARSAPLAANNAT